MYFRSSIGSLALRLTTLCPTLDSLLTQLRQCLYERYQSRVFCFILVIMVVPCDLCAQTPTPTPTPPPTYTPLPTYTPNPTDTPLCINHGDVNFDGSHTAGDAQTCFSIVLGVYSPTYVEECAADCDGGGSVTAGDAQTIFAVPLGLGECIDLNSPRTVQNT